MMFKKGAIRHQRAASGLTYGLVIGLISVLSLSAVDDVGGGVQLLFTQVDSGLLLKDRPQRPTSAPSPTVSPSPSPVAAFYSRPLTITNSTAIPVADFPVTLSFDSAALVSAGKMDSSCKDIRLKINGSEAPFQITGCNTTATVITFLADSNASTVLYYGDTSKSDASGPVSNASVIVNGDFASGTFTGWTTAPASASGTPDFWMTSGLPGDGVCPLSGSTCNTSDCNQPAATVAVRGTATGDAHCSPVSGCPTAVLGDGDLSLTGQCQNGNIGSIWSDVYQIPDGVYLHFWYNSHVVSAESGSTCVFYPGSPSEKSIASFVEGAMWSVILDADGDNAFETADTVVRDNILQDDHETSGSVVTDLTTRGGEYVRVMVSTFSNGCGDDSLIQIDDLYWSDAAGTPISLTANLSGAETPVVSY